VIVLKKRWVTFRQYVRKDITDLAWKFTNFATLWATRMTWLCI
jgi:hypothetical protein